ncbi:MAG: hypothetical protein IJT14_01820 [Rickettsiales bacterium]|nr:hypothetical protein [Rickettsiales bacterium]
MEKKTTTDDALRKEFKIIEAQKKQELHDAEYYKNFDELLQNRKGFADKFIEVYEKYGEEEGTQNMTYQDYNIIARAAFLNKQPFFWETSGKEKILKYKDKNKLDEKLGNCYDKAIEFKEKQNKNVINVNSINDKKNKGKGKK